MPGTIALRNCCTSRIGGTPKTLCIPIEVSRVVVPYPIGGDGRIKVLIHHVATCLL